MPLDHRQIFAVKPATFRTVPETMVDASAIYGLRQRAMENDQRIAQNDQAMADDKAVRGLFATTPNPTQAQVIGAAGPVQGARISAERAQADAAEAQRQRANLERIQRATSLVGQTLQGVTDDATLAAAKARLQSQGIPVDGLPAAYDQAAIASIIAQSLTVEESIKAEHDRLTREEAARANQMREFQTATTDAHNTAKSAAEQARQVRVDAEAVRHNKATEAADFLRAQRAGAADAKTDPLWERDFKEYEDYVKAHDRSQTKNYERDAAGKVVLDKTTQEPIEKPYVPPVPFADWRARNKGRTENGPTEPPPSTGKIRTHTQMRELAKQFNITTGEAIRRARAEGYIVR